MFGEIVNEKMILNNIGKIVGDVWFGLKNKFDVELDQFQIMPNHVHGIIVIECRGLIHQTQKTIKSGVMGVGGVMNHAPTLGQIIRFFKAKSVKMIHDISPNIRVWQRNYYEHIVRNEKELIAIRRYIHDNLINWGNDKENPNQQSFLR